MNNEDVKRQIRKLSPLLLKHIADCSEDRNLIFSPVSAYVLLAMAADASAGKTKDEIMKFLLTVPDDEAFLEVGKIQTQLSAEQSFSSANVVIVREDLEDTITPGYAEHLQSAFDGKLFSTNNMVFAVNEWVKKNSNGRITNIAEDSMKDTLLCMINACTFESEWAEQYKDRDIVNEDFHNSDGTVSRVNMLRSCEITYLETESFTGFVRPYQDDAFSYMVLLPKHGNNIDMKELTSFDWSTGMPRRENTIVEVLMPEFNCSMELEMKEICKNLGIQTLFTPEAGFAPISSAWLKADSLKHKAEIEVSRQGTKASAVTFADLECGALPLDFPEIKEIIVDRPFVYAIIHNAQDCLFSLEP